MWTRSSCCILISIIIVSVSFTFFHSSVFFDIFLQAQSLISLLSSFRYTFWLLFINVIKWTGGHEFCSLMRIGGALNYAKWVIWQQRDERLNSDSIISQSLLWIPKSKILAFVLGQPKCTFQKLNFLCSQMAIPECKLSITPKGILSFCKSWVPLFPVQNDGFT